MSAVKLESLWSVTAPPGPACSPLSGTQRAQAAVIGAGYTGLSAALHLAAAGREVVVLEAADIGERASGLNGGQVIPGVKLDPDVLERLLGPYAGGRLVATAGSGPCEETRATSSSPCKRALSRTSVLSSPNITDIPGCRLRRSRSMLGNT